MNRTTICGLDFDEYGVARYENERFQGHGRRVHPDESDCFDCQMIIGGKGRWHTAELVCYFLEEPIQCPGDEEHIHAVLLSARRIFHAYRAYENSEAGSQQALFQFLDDD